MWDDLSGDWKRDVEQARYLRELDGGPDNVFIIDDQEPPMSDEEYQKRLWALSAAVLGPPKKPWWRRLGR